jgi:hypothetical protein
LRLKTLIPFKHAGLKACVAEPWDPEVLDKTELGVEGPWVVAVAVNRLRSTFTLKLEILFQSILEHGLYKPFDVMLSIFEQRIFIYLLPPFL